MEQKRTRQDKAAYINFRADPAIKAQAEQLFDEMGLTMTTALNAFLRRAVLDGKMPFELMGREAVQRAAEDMRIYEALMVAQREAADPNTVYKSHEEVFAGIRGKYGI